MEHISWNEEGGGFLPIGSFVCLCHVFGVKQFLVAPAAEQSNLPSLYGVCLVGWLVVCLLVDRELNFRY